jgi:hypothetical protein
MPDFHDCPLFRPEAKEDGPAGHEFAEVANYPGVTDFVLGEWSCTFTFRRHRMTFHSPYWARFWIKHMEQSR